jgi:outer membrane protein TolC
MKATIKLLGYIVLLIPCQLSAQQHDLNFYIGKAKENSPFIHKNISEKKVVQLDMEQLKSIYSKPEVTVEAGVLFAPIISHDNNKNQFRFVSKDATDYNGYDLAATDGGQYQAVVSLKQGLFTGSKYKTYQEKADIQNQISDNNIELTNHELENAVTHQYILCLKSEKQAKNSLELIKQVEDELNTMQTLVENAVLKKTDLMLLEITKQNYQQEYETFKSEYKSNIYDLNLLCGINDESEVILQDTTFLLNPEIHAGSRFLKSYYLDSLSIAADRKIFELKYKPDVNFIANGGMNAVYLPAFNRLGFATGLTFSMYLFDGNQRDIERQRSEINLETLNFEKEKIKQQNIIQKNFTLSRIQSINDRIQLASQQLEQYEKLLYVYEIQLKKGEISVMDYKYFIKEIATKKQEKLLLEMEKQIVVNAYNYWNY